MRRCVRAFFATIAFLLLFALFAASSAASPEEPLPVGYSGEWLGSVAALASLVFALAFIILGVAKLLHLRSLEFATKHEMFQVFASLAIAGFVFAGGLDWILGIMGGAALYAEAKEFIDSTWNTALKVYTETIIIRALANLLASVKLGGEAGVVIAGVSLSLHPFAFLKPVATALERMGWLFIFTLFSLKVHSVLLWFGHTLALKLFLGPGVLLRAFKVTRVAGAFLIGLALSLYLVFPALVVGVYKASYDQGKAELAKERAEKVREIFEDYRRDLFSLSWDLGSFLAKVALVPYALYTLIHALFDALMTYVEELILLFIVLPVVTILLLATVTASITEALGGRSYIIERLATMRRGV